MEDELKKIYKNYKISAIIIAVLIIVFIGTSKIIDSKTNIKSDNSIMSIEQFQKENDYDIAKADYETLNNHLIVLNDYLENFLDDNSNDNSIIHRFYYNKATIYDREHDRISAVILEKIPDNLKNTFNADVLYFKNQRQEKCKKLSYGIDDAKLKEIEYYKTYSNLTKDACSDLLEKYRKYLE